MSAELRRCAASGVAEKKRFWDWLWSTKGPRAAEWSTTLRCVTSQTVLNTRRRSSGTSSSACTEPSAASSRSRRASVHRPRASSWRMRLRLTTTNSPASVVRLKKLANTGSKHSLLPRIWEVVAVGMSAVSRLLRAPPVAAHGGAVAALVPVS
jgi:hypothetical protein